MLTRPRWIELSEEDRLNIRYVWDDTRAASDFKGDATPVVAASMRMSLRARMVLCVGLYEWVHWRFQGLHARTETLQITEAAWCATVDPRYMAFFELTRLDWLGPIEGPLWCASMWLQPAMSKGYMYPRKIYDALDFLTRLLLHVLPTPDRFESWTQFALDRLSAEYPVSPEDPFEDLFDRRVSRRLGPLIGRNVLDPQIQSPNESGAAFLAEILFESRVQGNPYLATPGELRDAGFIGDPYVLT